MGTNISRRFVDSSITRKRDDAEDQEELISSRARGSTTSVTSAETPNKSGASNSSSVSLVWDDSGDLLETRLEAEEFVGRSKDSTCSSVDIDDIVSKFAPNLSRCDVDTFDTDTVDMETIKPSKASRVGEFLERRLDKMSQVVNSPMRHQTVYVSITNLDNDDETAGEKREEEDCQQGKRNRLQSSPNNDTEIGRSTSMSCQMPSPIQFSLPTGTSTLNLNVPGPLSLSASPVSQLDEFLSFCSSMDSYKTIINDDSSENVNMSEIQRNDQQAMEMKYEVNFNQ